MTKEELLQKGLSEETADEVIKADLFTENPDENSLQSLEKALNPEDPEMDSLAKAGKKDEGKKEEDDEDKEDYNEKYMKKNMKRYMKENKKSCQKMMKEMDEYGDDMKKAIDDIDLDSEGAVIEMVDLKPFVEKLGTVIEGMAKAIPELSERIEVVSAQADKNFSLMEKAARLQVDQAKNIGEFMSEPTGRKSVDVNLRKAGAVDPEAAKFSKEDNRIIYKTLMKAVKDRDKDAGMVISAFESSGQNANRLSKPHKEFVCDLMKKEAN